MITPTTLIKPISTQILFALTLLVTTVTAQNPKAVAGAQYHLKRGNDYAAQKQWQQAIAEYKQAQALDPQNAALYNASGLACVGLAEFPRAAWYFSAAIRLNPTYAEAYANCGLAHLRQGQTVHASKDFAKSQALDQQMKAYIEKALSKK